jgi:hypothetical protein
MCMYVSVSRLLCVCVRVCGCFCFTLVVRVCVHACSCACVLLLHAEPAPLLPAVAWLGRLSAAPPFAAATLLFSLL